MIYALVYAALSLCCVLAVAATFVFGVRPALNHRRHERTLANIARLEVELGYDVPLEQRIDRELGKARYAVNMAKAWDYAEQQAGRPLDRVRYDYRDPPEPGKRIYGHCAMCGLHVALNAGWCRGKTASRDAECAKLVWLRAQDRA